MRLTGSLRVDGRLDEDVYGRVPPVNGFVQQEPHEGQPATEDTDLWFFFDDTNLYIAARCWDSHPEREVANEMRRDHGNLAQNESLTFVFDTFRDLRSSFHFLVNRLGGVSDGTGTDERSYNGDWNTVWTVRTSTFDLGWTLEWAIPFRSLRYRVADDPVWGVNVRRNVRWKNETSFLAPIPAYLGLGGLMSMSLAATMTGLRLPPSGRNLEVKAYAIAGTRRATVTESTGHKNAGLDVKYGLTKGLTFDFTYRTDFAQVEDDQQQVNLTRFSLFFPERREFFLEGSGIFAFGGSVGGGSLGPDSDPDDTPVLFFSRRIGLDDASRQVPLSVGTRITGKAGPYSIGALAIQSSRSRESPQVPTTFTAFRLKRDFLRRSYAGVIYTGRDPEQGTAGRGHTYGADARYSLSPAAIFNGYWASTSDGREGRRGTSYLIRADYNRDLVGGRAERVSVNRSFNPQVGFLRRTDFVRDFGQLRYSPRPRGEWLRGVRKITYRGSVASYSNESGARLFEEKQAQINLDLQSSDRVDLQYEREYELVPNGFALSRRHTVPAGSYDSDGIKFSYLRGAHRRVGGWFIAETGRFYGGTKRRLEYRAGRIVLSSRVQIEPSIAENWIDLPGGRLLATVVSTRPTISLSPRFFASALLQYNSGGGTLSTNLRVRWEYLPGSEVFVVYSDGRDTGLPGTPVQNRALVVKVNRLLMF